MRDWWRWFAAETGHPLMALLVLAVLLAAGPGILFIGMAKAFDARTFSAAVNRKATKEGQLMQRQELLNEASKVEHETSN